MRRRMLLQNVLIGSTAALIIGARLLPGADKSGPVATAAAAIITGKPAAPAPSVPSAVTTATSGAARAASTGATAELKVALDAFSSVVGRLSSPSALEDAFKAYYAFKDAHANEVKKPYLYFVDYGLPSTTQRGYVFDMSTLHIVEGPFTVAHGRGSSTSQYGIPTRFSNSSGSAETSLGLYVTQALYSFTGHTGGHAYSSIGMRLEGVSTGFNDKAFGRGVVAHGAPYVTPTRAGRSEGCPAMEPSRAERLLPKLAEGSLVFLYAPDSHWLAGDPWLASS